MTPNEQDALQRLQSMLNSNKWIEMSLWPPQGGTTIERTNNQLVINEGRDGRWDDISKAFYDSIVCTYDSRERSAAKFLD